MKLLDDAVSFIGDLPTESIARVAENLLLPERDKLPLVMCFYLTFRCNAACDFCSQGEQVYGEQKGKFKLYDQELTRHMQILELICEDVPNIYFLGGEPTVYPGFKEMLEESSRLGFENIAVNTNGLLFKPEILEHADLLVMSLHCDDSEKTAQIYQTALPKGEDVYENFRRYARERDPKLTKMVVNCVVTGDSIDDAYDVAQLAAAHGVQLNIAPAIGKDGRPDSRLINNPEYQKLIDWVSRQKSRGKDLSSASAKYLETIRAFESFDCNPQTVPGVHPNGDLIVPCPNLPEGAENVNLLEVGSVRRALRIGRERWEEKHGILDTQQKCRDMCHKTCYVETAGLGTPQGVKDLIRAEFENWRLKRRLKVFDPTPRQERGDSSPNQAREEAEIQAIYKGKICHNSCCHPGQGSNIQGLHFEDLNEEE